MVKTGVAALRLRLICDLTGGLRRPANFIPPLRGWSDWAFQLFVSAENFSSGCETACYKTVPSLRDSDQFPACPNAEKAEPSFVTTSEGSHLGVALCRSCGHPSLVAADIGGVRHGFARRQLKPRSTRKAQRIGFYSNGLCLPEAACELMADGGERKADPSSA